MIWDDRAAVDFNWHTITIEGQSLLCKKWGSKVARKTTKIWRLGNRRPVARTIGTSAIEDMTLEFDYAAGLKFLSIFGVSDFNPANVDFAGRVFEMLDVVSDPRPVANNVGTATNVYTNCEVISLESSGEVGETPTSFIVGISVLDGTIARGAAGGGAIV